MAQVFCFGDSVTYGLVDPVGGWVQRVRAATDQKYKDTHNYGVMIPRYEVYNLGVPGETTRGLLDRFESEIKPRLFAGETVVVIGLGTNDSVYRDPGMVLEMTEVEYAANLKMLIEKSRVYTNKILLVGLLPCNEKLMQPMPWSTTGKSYSNERLALFNQVLVRVAHEEKVPVVDMFKTLLKRDSDEYLTDGIHPNEVGHALFAEDIIRALDVIEESIS